MLSLIANAFVIYLLIGLGISAYQNINTRNVIIQLFWQAVKWPIILKKDKSLKR